MATPILYAPGGVANSNLTPTEIGILPVSNHTGGIPGGPHGSNLEPSKCAQATPAAKQAFFDWNNGSDHEPIANKTPPPLADARLELLAMAARWQAAGCLVHPAKADGSKTPHNVRGAGTAEHGYGWKKLSAGEMTMPPEWLANAFKRLDGIGIFTGRISGELEMVELEGRAAHLVNELRERADAAGLGDLWQRFDAGCSETTPSGGVHWYLRVSDGPAGGNTKLAQRLVDGLPVVFAETRGQGGWTVCAGSHGATHKSGLPYVIRTGSPAGIPFLSLKEREALYGLFRSLDEMPVAAPYVATAQPLADVAAAPGGAIAGGDDAEWLLRPGDDFNQRGPDWADILAGWTRQQIEGERQHWTRPGKSNGTSATTTLGDGPSVLWVFSSSTTLPAGKGLTKFAAFTLLNHGGDYTAATRELVAAGYGAQRPSPAVAAADALPLREEPLPAVREVPLVELRDDLAAAFAGVAAAPPGLTICTHDTGSGKTFSAIEHFVSKFDVCTVNVATHEAAAEMVGKLVEAGHGDKVAAFPAHATTCKCFTADDAAGLLEQYPKYHRILPMKAALEVGQPYLACRHCPLFEPPATPAVDLSEWGPGEAIAPPPTGSRCEYHRLKAVAEAAPIRVQCHERTRRQPESVQAPPGLTAGLFTDEHADAVLLPRTMIRGGDFVGVADALATAVDNWKNAKGRMRWITARERHCELVRTGAASVGEVLKGILERGEGDECDAPQGERELLEWGVAVIDAARKIVEHIEELVAAGVPGVFDFPKIWPKAASKPKRANDQLGEMLARATLPKAFNSQALEVVRLVATGRFPSATILLGQLPGGAVYATVVRSSVFNPPGVTHLVADAHADVAAIRRMIPEAVEIAPAGVAPMVEQAEQVWLEINPRTKLETVVAAIERTLDANGWQRAGLILTKRHRRVLFPWAVADGIGHDVAPDLLAIANAAGHRGRALTPETLPARLEAAGKLVARLDAMRSRLARDEHGRCMIEHHLGAGSRGTNRFVGRVDGLAVVGLTRLNPTAIAAAMIASGQRDLAHGGGEWGECTAQLPTVEGGEDTFRFRGYGNPEWAAAAAAGNRASLLQAAGRARSRMAGGCPLVVVSAEPTGLPVRTWAAPVGTVANVVAAVERLGSAGGLRGENTPESGQVFWQSGQSDDVLDLLGTGGIPKEGKTKNAFTCEKVSGHVSIRDTIRPLARYSAPVGSLQIATDLELPIRTVKRHLKAAVEAGLIVRTGAARAVKYALPTPAGVTVTASRDSIGGVLASQAGCQGSELPAAASVTRLDKPVLKPTADPLPATVAQVRAADLFEERAAFLEFDAGFIKAAAERAALEMLSPPPPQELPPVEPGGLAGAALAVFGGRQSYGEDFEIDPTGWPAADGNALGLTASRGLRPRPPAPRQKHLSLSVDRRFAQGWIGEGSSRIAVKVTVTSPRGRFFAGG